MAYQAHGRHCIAGEWVDSDDKFESTPATGDRLIVSKGSAELIDRAVQAAEACMQEFSSHSRRERAALLRLIAEEIDRLGDEITAMAHAETALPEARLIGERGRTVMQLNLFADHIEKGDYLDIRHDAALPDRQPLARPDLKMMQLPIGPVAVFGASNFPLAFSVAGGDTASALAAGCPVIVKGHEAHPGTSELVAAAVSAAVAKSAMPAGVFSMVQGGSIEVGRALVQHPFIEAVGFTGSLNAGRALFDLCAQRAKPVPFFGELGSINPIFMLPEKLQDEAERLGDAWSASLALGVGQFCTNPGVAVVPSGLNGDRFVGAATAGLAKVAAQPMLTDGIAAAYRAGCNRLANVGSVKSLMQTASESRHAAPCLFEVDAKDWLADESLWLEVFGPVAIVVRTTSDDEMLRVAHALEGQLTCTLHLSDADSSLASRLLSILSRKAGRLLANGFPTGVEVADSMVHGGPYPASTNFGATSVGTLAIRRFLRPVCFQNLPDALLPCDLRGS